MVPVEGEGISSGGGAHGVEEAVASSYRDLLAQVEDHIRGVLSGAGGASGEVDSGDVPGSWVGPQGFRENVEAFISAVDWSEGWIQGLLAFHVCYFLAVVLTYKSYGAQVFLFLLGCALVKASEVGNTYLAANWETFSRQNYFDENGLFVACMWAGPLLFVLVLQAFNFIRMNANLLVKLKRRQLLERAKEGKKKK